MLFRTTTNVYLLNLAVVDMATVVLYLPFEVYDLWHQYPWMFGHVGCDLKTLLQETITYASILTVVSFSVERYHSFLVTKATSVSISMTITHQAITTILIIFVLLDIWQSVNHSIHWQDPHLERQRLSL